MCKLVAGHKLEETKPVEEWVKSITELAVSINQKKGELIVMERKFEEEKSRQKYYRLVDVAKIPRGGMFGELALLGDTRSGRLRKARITCAEDCCFATLHRAQFK